VNEPFAAASRVTKFAIIAKTNLITLIFAAEIRIGLKARFTMTKIVLSLCIKKTEFFLNTNFV